MSKFGFRLQYSVFEITNSDTVLKNIENEIQNLYLPSFTEEDSVIIFNLSETCKKTCYGYAKNEEKDVFGIKNLPEGFYSRIGPFYFESEKYSYTVTLDSARVVDKSTGEVWHFKEKG